MFSISGRSPGLGTCRNPGIQVSGDARRTSTGTYSYMFIDLIHLKWFTNRLVRLATTNFFLYLYRYMYTCQAVTRYRYPGTCTGSPGASARALRRALAKL